MVTGKHSGKHVVGGRVPDYHLVGRRNGYYRDNDDNEHDNDLELINKDNDNEQGTYKPGSPRASPSDCPPPLQLPPGPKRLQPDNHLIII